MSHGYVGGGGGRGGCLFTYRWYGPCLCIYICVYILTKFYNRSCHPKDVMITTYVKGI